MAFINNELDVARIDNANVFSKDGQSFGTRSPAEILALAAKNGKLFVGPSVDRQEEIKLNSDTLKALENRLKTLDPEYAASKVAINLGTDINRLCLAFGQLTRELGEILKNNANGMAPEFHAAMEKITAKMPCDPNSALSKAYEGAGRD